MKLRYQMRGLGIGIIVTALLMGVVKGEKLPLSDAEIKARASELGMVESDSLRLSDISNGTPSSEGRKDPEGESGNPSQGDGETSGKDGDSEPGSGSESGEAPDPGSGDSAGGTTDPGEEPGEGQSDGLDTSDADPGTADGDIASGTEGGNGPETDEDMVTVVIEEGVTSYSVCVLLEELGLVEDADSLDYYICSNSYSRSILHGTYKIRRGTEPEEIVRIIMGKR